MPFGHGQRHAGPPTRCSPRAGLLLTTGATLASARGTFSSSTAGPDTALVGVTFDEPFEHAAGEAATTSPGLPVRPVVGSDFARCLSPPGQHATCKHLGGGAANFTLRSCKAEMLRLRGDSVNFKPTPGKCWVKRCGSKDMQYSSQFGEYEVYSTFCVPCHRPTTWCTREGEWYDASEDCDGDGIPDPACRNNAGAGGFFASDASCTSTWPGESCEARRTGAQGFFGRLRAQLEGMGTFGKFVKQAEAEGKKLKAKLAPAQKAVVEVYKGINKPNYNAPSQLGGNDRSTINLAVWVIIFLVVSSTAVAGYMDYFWRPKALEGRPKLWAMTMLGTSYLLLIPGLMNVLLSFSIVVNVVGHRIRVHPNADEPACTESTPGMVDLLYNTGGKVGACLLVLFAMVIPALELIFLVLGELCRFKVSSTFAKAFRMTIIWVQHRSKWASPDMFAYTLLVYLIRDMEHYPLILTNVQLDVGFACFCAFCVCATVSAVGFPLPQIDEEEDGAKSVEASPPLLLRCFGRWGLAIVTSLLSGTCLALLAKGAQDPVMSFRINERPLYQPVGPLPKSAKVAVDMLDIPNMLKADVSLLQCIQAMAGWARGGEATSGLATLMWGAFVLGLTALDVVVLCCSVWRLCLHGCGRPFNIPGLRTGSAPCPFTQVAKLLKKLAMLDVAVVGIYLVTYCMAIYEHIGVMVRTRHGVETLLAAEIIHNILYWMVTSVSESSGKAIAPYVATTFEEMTEQDEQQMHHHCGVWNCFFKPGVFEGTVIGKALGAHLYA